MRSHRSCPAPLSVACSGLGPGRLPMPLPDRPELAYRFAGETLQGTFKGEGRVRLTRVADMNQAGCGPPAGGLPP